MLFLPHFLILDCRTCDRKHSQRFWKKKICEKRYLLSASLTSYKRKESRFIFEASRITELDRSAAHWQDEKKDIRVVIDRGCKCQWITGLLDKMKKKGQERKEFLIMTDEAIINENRLVLSSNDYIMEANTEMQGKAFMTTFRRCKRKGPMGWLKSRVNNSLIRVQYYYYTVLVAEWVFKKYSIQNSILFNIIMTFRLTCE